MGFIRKQLAHRQRGRVVKIETRKFNPYSRQYSVPLGKDK